LCDGAQMANFCVLYFQRSACSTFQTCILYSHKGDIMCESAVDIQFATAENRRGKKKKEEETTAVKWPAHYYVRAATVSTTLL